MCQDEFYVVNIYFILVTLSRALVIKALEERKNDLTIYLDC